MSLKIVVQPSRTTAATSVVALEGSLDTATAPGLEEALTPLLEQGPRHLVFDLAKLRFVSSAGLRVLLAAHKRLKSVGGSIVLNNPQPQIQKVFEIIKALPDIQVFRSDAELDAYLAAIQRRSG